MDYLRLHLLYLGRVDLGDVPCHRVAVNAEFVGYFPQAQPLTMRGNTSPNA